MLPEVRDDELAELYAWVDGLPLSKPKRHFARDFADGVSVAELVHHYFPRLVELHNYSPTSNAAQKAYNWSTLNQRVFRKLAFSLPREVCTSVALAEPGIAERVLKLLRAKLAAYQAQHATRHAAAERQATLASPPTAYGYASPAAMPPAPAQQLGGKFASSATPPAPLGQQREEDQGWIRACPHPGAEAELQELRALNQILELKAAKLEQLLRLKDAKVAALEARVVELSGGGGGVGMAPPLPYATAVGAVRGASNRGFM